MILSPTSHEQEPFHLKSHSRARAVYTSKRTHILEWVSLYILEGCWSFSWHAWDEPMKHGGKAMFQCRRTIQRSFRCSCFNQASYWFRTGGGKKVTLNVVTAVEHVPLPHPAHIQSTCAALDRSPETIPHPWIQWPVVLLLRTKKSGLVQSANRMCTHLHARRNIWICPHTFCPQHHGMTL